MADAATTKAGKSCPHRAVESGSKSFRSDPEHLVGRYAKALLEAAVGSCDPEVAVAKVEAGGLELVSRGSVPN
jgi:hypothetical protein